MSLKNLLLFVYILGLVLFIDIMPKTPDTQLYIGLADNLLQNGVYEDNIRRDEILPSIGHPFLIAMSKMVWEKAMPLSVISLFIFFSIVFFANSLFFTSYYLSMLLSLLAAFFFKDMIADGGVESSLILSFSFLAYCLLNIFKNGVSNKNIALLSFSIALSVLIRPLFYPLIFFSIIIIVFCLIRKKYKIALSLAVFPLIIVVMLAISFNLCGDSRMVTGTYGSIPLYAGFNEYIPLEKTYNSTLWRKISIEKQKMAFDPLINKSGWKDRDALLKEKVVKFIYRNPQKAINAYLFRLKKYTFFSDIDNYNYMITLFVSLFFIVLFMSVLVKRAFFILNLSILAILLMYTFSMVSFFVYAGARYLAVPIVLVLMFFLYLLYLFKILYKELFQNESPEKPGDSIPANFKRPLTIIGGAFPFFRFKDFIF